MAKVALTTIDNPFNPFTHWIEWYTFDMRLGHRTCERLASISNTSDANTDEENDALIEEAINRIVNLEPLLFIKVKESDDWNKVKALQKELLESLIDKE